MYPSYSLVIDTSLYHFTQTSCPRGSNGQELRYDKSTIKTMKNNPITPTRKSEFSDDSGIIKNKRGQRHFFFGKEGLKFTHCYKH